MSRSTNYPDIAQFRMPWGFLRTVQDAAANSYLSPPEFMRRAMLTGLETMGVALPKLRRRPRRFRPMAKAFRSGGEDPIEVASFPKTKRESVRVCLLQWSGEPRIDVRVMAALVKEEGVIVPTQKGLSLRLEQLATLREALDLADAKARDLGWIKP